MAIKPTIYKFAIALSDINRGHYDSLNLTVAQHPSETSERMMVRVLAYCLNAQEFLSFGKGLSSAEEPDLWVKTLDDQIALWIDVGEPAVERIKKSHHQSDALHIYCFNNKADVWWQQSKDKLSRLDVAVTQFPWEQIQRFTKMLARNVDISVTITGDSAYIAGASDECEVTWTPLRIA